MITLFKSNQNVLRILTVRAHRTHANLAFVTVGQRRNAVLEEPIHVQLGNANAGKIMSVYPQKRVRLENANVSYCSYPENFDHSNPSNFLYQS